MHRPGTPEYKTVCGSGAPGTMVDPITGAQFEIDECTMMSGVCGSQGTCVNTIGSFKCDCRQRTLVVLDHSQNYTITNHNHIFKAMKIVFDKVTCRANFVFDFLLFLGRSGYAFDESSHQCIDINECLPPPFFSSGSTGSIGGNLSEAVLGRLDHFYC